MTPSSLSHLTVGTAQHNSPNSCDVLLLPPSSLTGRGKIIFLSCCGKDEMRPHLPLSWLIVWLSLVRIHLLSCVFFTALASNQPVPLLDSWQSRILNVKQQRSLPHVLSSAKAFIIILIIPQNSNPLKPANLTWYLHKGMWDKTSTARYGWTFPKSHKAVGTCLWCFVIVHPGQYSTSSNRFMDLTSRAGLLRVSQQFYFFFPRLILFVCQNVSFKENRLQFMYSEAHNVAFVLWIHLRSFHNVSVSQI